MSMYFKDSEFACRCCGELPPNGMNSVLLEKLDTLREMACEPVYVTCGYRCPKHNAEVGGVRRRRRFKPPVPSVTIIKQRLDSVFSFTKERHIFFTAFFKNIFF